MKRALLSFCLSFFVLNLFAQGDCLPEWSYYREVDLQHSGGQALSDFQFSFPMNTGELVSAGKLRSDGADLRVVDADCNAVPFFVDSAATSVENVIWVRLPELAQGATATLRVYYGNPDADSPAADGDATFLFFDDFSSGVVDPGKWEAVGEYAQLEVVDGVLRYASTGTAGGSRFKFLRSQAAFSEPVFWDFNIVTNNSGSFGHCSADTVLERTLFRYNSGASDTLSYLAVMQDTFSNGYVYSLEYPDLIVPRSVEQEVSVVTQVNTDQHLVYQYFGANSQGTSTITPLEIEIYDLSAVNLIFSTFSSLNTVYVDYVRVRRAFANPPDVEVGEEQEQMTSAVGEVIPLAVRAFPNPASGLLFLEMEEPGLAWSLIDLVGRQVASGQFEEGRQSIELDPSWKGLYFVRVTDPLAPGRTWSRRVVLQ